METGLQTPSEPAGSALAAMEASMPKSWIEGGAAVLDASGRILQANEQLAQWIECPLATLPGESFWDTLAALCPEWASAFHALQNRDASFDRVTLRAPGRDGAPAQWFTLEVARGLGAIFARVNSTLPPLAELEEASWDEHLRSDAARRELFTRMLRAESRLDSLMRRWPCVVISQRADFSIQFISPNSQQLTGLSAADCMAQPQWFWRLVHEGDVPQLEQQFKRCVQTRSAITNTYRIRHAVTGRVAYVMEHRQPSLSRNGLLLGYEVVWLDVTRQTIAERRLSTAAWKETLAVLTLGMAHDFTNIIAGIHSLSESFQSQMSPGHPFAEGIGLIKKNSLQASQLVQRMVNLHVGQVGERSYQNLNEITADLAELVKKILPRRISVDIELAPGRLPVYLDAVEFRQVVINLILNAADAMPRGGSLSLRTSRHEQLPKLDNMKGVTPRLPAVCLSIEDSGSGIKPAHLAAIFDPFFTTKAKGSGLGLYNARLAMEKHQGAIAVTSRENVGTSFHLWLAEADLSEPRPEEALQRSATRLSLLLLGQPGDMRDKAAELLRSQNFNVVIAATADDLSDLRQSADYHFNGVLILAEARDPVLATLPGELRHQIKNAKIVLKLVGCNQDDADSRLLGRADLVLNPDLSDADMLTKLKAFFEPAG